MDYNCMVVALAVPEADYPTDTDILGVAAAIEAASVSRIFGITTDEAIRWWPQPLPICRRN
jgi:hypothetical protein